MPTKDPSQPTVATPGTDSSTLRERFFDALGVLDEGGMRWRVLGVTIAFPAVMLLGGALTKLSDSVLLHLLAAVPALLLLGVVGAFGQYVLTITLQGLAHAENPPRPVELLRQAPRMLPRLAALGATFLGPGLLVVMLGYPVGVMVMLGGLLLLPVATALLLGTGSWRALDPRLVVAAIRRAGRATLNDAAVAAAMCAPALLALLLTRAQSPFTTIAVVGPLAATPALLAARMIGLTLCERRQALAGLFALPAVEELATATKLAKPAAPRAKPKTAAPAVRRPATAPTAKTARRTVATRPATAPAARPPVARHTPLASRAAPAAPAQPAAAVGQPRAATRPAASSTPRTGK